MNYSAPPQKYDNISQPSQNINSINQGFYQQPVMNYPGVYYNNFNPYNYNYIQNPNYMPQASQNFYNTIVPDSSQRAKVEKRESKPLTVIDPTKNEVLDLNKISKSKNILIDEIKPSDQSQPLIPNLMISKESTNSYDGKLELPVISVSVTSVKEVETIKPEILEETILKPNSLLLSSQSIKQSQSIPNKLDNLFEDKLINQIISSSDTDLHSKTILDENERKIYHRDSLIEIGKSTRSQKLPSTLEKFECKEIINTTPTDASKLLEFYGKSKRFGKIINIGSPRMGSLSRIVNGYLPPHLRLKEECSLNKNLENCRRNLKCILNKIAPQNFSLCINEIKTIIKSSDQQNVKIDDCIDCLIEEIFDKAVKEEAYSVTYANLCFNIAKLDDDNDSKWNFKSSLLNRCKQMFETPLQDQLKSVKNHWEKKVEEEVDEKLKNLYRSDIEEQIKKARDKYFGNIRFIGELYVHDLLKPKIIHCCVNSLLPKPNDEDAMLSLCKLLETCGKKFDEKHSDKMSDYIKNMTGMLETPDLLGTRIRCKILDIIEMSERKWLLREVQSQKMVRPKTLEEVKKDASDDKSISALKFPTLKSNNRLNTKPIQNQSELKFKQQNRNQSIDLNSLSLGPNESLELKPSYGSWNSNKEKDQSEWKNVDNKKRTKTKYSSTNKHSQNRFSPNKITDEPSNKAHLSKYAILSAQDDIKDNNIISSESPVRSVSPCESKSEDDAVTMDGEELLDNLLETHTLNMTAWGCQLKISELINQWLDKIMEKKQRDRHLVGDQLANLVACNKLEKEALIEGLNQFVDLIDDLITDIPTIWTFLAEILERFIQDKNSYVEFYKIVFENRLPNKHITECIFLILEYANERVGNSVIKFLIDNKLEDLLDLIKKDDDISSLFEKHKLTFIFDTTENTNSSTTEFTDAFKNELISSLPNDDENIFELLESKFTIEQMQTVGFVNSLAYCLFSFICDLKLETDIIDFLIEKQCLFMRIINSKSAFETQFLLVLVNFANRLHQRDLLKTLVQNLAGIIISTDACQHFINNSDLKDLETNDENYQLTVDAIRFILGNQQR